RLAGVIEKSECGKGPGTEEEEEEDSLIINRVSMFIKNS
ncbi:jg4382, partial [Pararge aegeria aegeria]